MEEKEARAPGAATELQQKLVLSGAGCSERDRDKDCKKQAAVLQLCCRSGAGCNGRDKRQSCETGRRARSGYQRFS